MISDITIQTSISYAAFSISLSISLAAFGVAMAINRLIKTIEKK